MTRAKNSNYKQVTVNKHTDKDLVIHSDIMYANNIPFLLSVAKPLNLLLCSELQNGRNSTNLSQLLVTHINILKSQGFNVCKIIVDEERGLNACSQAMNENGVELVVVSTGEHVNVAERAIRVIKERARSIVADLPYGCPELILGNELIRLQT